MIATDIIGNLYTPGTFDAEGSVIAAPEPVAGYHVNTTHPVADWAAFKVTPATPRRVFGGGTTHYYTFADAAEFEAHLDTADMSIPTVQVVPTVITKRQAERVLQLFGMLDAVEAAVAAAPIEVQIDWRSGQDIDRHWPALLAMQAGLGFTDAQLDQMFLVGSTL